MDPAWTAIGIPVAGAIVTGFVAYHAALRGTAVAIARMEERQSAHKDQLHRITETLDAQAEILGDHGERLAVLERWPRMQQPADYPR